MEIISQLVDFLVKPFFLYFIYKRAISKELKEMQGSCISKEQSGITLGRLWADFGLPLAVLGHPWGCLLYTSPSPRD